jgi:hypothetical protein
MKDEEECPHCERYKQRVELWRQEVYRLSERQWVDLTDREMMDAIYIDDTPMEMGRKIQAKLKEKNT